MKTQKPLINLDELVSTLTTEEEKKREGGDKPIADENFLSFKAGHTYLVRLLPNVKNSAKTFTDYEEYGFKGLNDQYIYAGRTPHSIGRKDIIKDLQWKTYSEGKKINDEDMMRRSYQLFAQRKQMVNVYVIDDPVNPENNGTVKILRYSAKTNKDGEAMSPLYAKIHDAVFGDGASDIGKRAFDLTKDGVNFSIKVKKNTGGWNDYAESSFKFPSDLGLSTDEISEIYSQTKDLEEFIPEVKSDEDLQSLLAVHWYGNEEENKDTAEVSNYSSDDSNDDIPMEFASVASVGSEGSIDDDMDSFLDGIENL